MPNELTPRQVQILKYIAKGTPVKLIAHNEQLAIKTVEAHISSLRKSLLIFQTADLIHYAIRRGYVKLKTYDQLSVSPIHRGPDSDVDDSKPNKRLDN